jgi:thiopeptide-type bacteriocin biosynthesis protein
VDSDAVLGLLQVGDDDDATAARWRIAARSIDQLLDDLGLTTPAKHRLLDQLSSDFRREFRADADLQHSIGARFRGERASIEALLDRTLDAGSPYAPSLAVLHERSRLLAPLVDELRGAVSGGELDALVPSFVHMHVNRLLRSAHRAQELVLYDFLARVYDSQLKRNRRAPASSA